jgi:hypothetical protein
LAWQFLFVIGAVSYLRISDRDPISTRAWLPILASVIAGTFVIFHTDAVSVIVFGPDLPRRLVTNKYDLALFRLINFLAVAALVAHFLRRDNFIFRWSLLRPISLCGQHSLLVFCIGVILALIAKPIWENADTDFGTRLIILAVAVMIMVVAALFNPTFARLSRRFPGRDRVSDHLGQREIAFGASKR